MTEKEVCMAMEMVVKDCNLSTLETYGKFQRAFKLADGVGKLRKMITPELLDQVMPLQNTALGFRTDRPTGYEPNVVKESFIEATLRGLSPVGNEFNIISGRCYVTKEGFSRLLKELPDFTDLKLFFEVPKTSTGGAVVKSRATWKYQGKADELEREIPVRVNGGMGADAILGKAERKLKAAIYQQITGSMLSDGDVEDRDAIGTTATKSEKASAVSEALRGENGESK